MAGYDQYQGISNDITNQAQGAGLFNPLGSPVIQSQVRRGALRNADNSRRRSALLARLMGLDPNQSRVAAVNADTQASGDTANALNESQLQQSLGNQQFARGLFHNQLGYYQNLHQQEQARKQAQHDQFMGMAGQLGGAAVGSFFGNPAAGAAIGKQVAGGGSQQTPTNNNRGTYNGYDPYWSPNNQ